jgi:hypothetical protein
MRIYTRLGFLGFCGVRVFLQKNVLFILLYQRLTLLHDMV